MRAGAPWTVTAIGSGAFLFCNVAARFADGGHSVNDGPTFTTVLDLLPIEPIEGDQLVRLTMQSQAPVFVIGASGTAASNTLVRFPSLFDPWE